MPNLYYGIMAVATFFLINLIWHDLFRKFRNDTPLAFVMCIASACWPVTIAFMILYACAKLMTKILDWTHTLYDWVFGYPRED